MITKRDYAMHVVKEYYKERGVEDPCFGEDLPIEILEDLKKDIYSSSSLAVALEFLLDFRNTDFEAYGYTSTRGGTLVTCINREREGDDMVHILSVREMLDLLPESL